jgi:ubiquinone/menaquinone biosynthesis C-methylase UbiE
MDVSHESQGEQTKLWNGPAGRSWVDAQPLLDQILKPFEDVLVAALSSELGSSVLDVGCGTGSTTLALARLSGPVRRCTGIDISEPMIAAARARAERERTPASFICADAQSYAFEPESVDAIVSRFGVMFFDDPARAFANLRRAARRGAELHFVAWRSASENPFMTTAERIAAPLLPNLPPRRPGAPGQFAFADDRRVRAILEESGWTEIDIRPLDLTCALPEKKLISYVTRLGPVGLILQEADERTRAQVVEAVRPAFDPYVQGTEVRFTAASWMAGARAA